MPDQKPPNPGSPEALALGCICPILDNGRGLGMRLGQDGEPVFVTVVGCGVHEPNRNTDMGKLALYIIEKETPNGTLYLNRDSWVEGRENAARVPHRHANEKLLRMAADGEKGIRMVPYEITE